MGLSIDRECFEESDYQRFADRLRVGLRALEQLLERPGFGEGRQTLGAELEVSVVDAAGHALHLDRGDLPEQLDPCITLEIDRFNLEYNLPPVEAQGRPFTALERDLAAAQGVLAESVAGAGGRVVAVGILPTLEASDLEAEAMADVPRFRALSDGLKRQREGPFRIRIDGRDPLHLACEDVTYEGAGTALQLHLRVAPSDYARVYNALQLATPVALAICGNSPLFLGHRLWDETRISLFKQSVDGRSEATDWRRSARVSFGHGWARRGIHELFAESVALHAPLLPVVGSLDPLEQVRAGDVPELMELRIHQGTVWRWNRAIYDPAEGGHLRIEARSLPAGPTPLDMAANAAFLLGLALGLFDEIEAMVRVLPFEYAEHSFYRAAQHGLDAGLLWPSPNAPSPRERPARELVRELLPVAERGLERLGVEARESAAMLGVIAGRLESQLTPARWQRRVLEGLGSGRPGPDALARMLEAYLDRARSGRPLHEWSCAA